jgi:ATP-dependent Lhr-like helicase
MDALELFHPRTARWFSRAVGAPTAVQEAAWPLIAVGRHTLVSAPTGTGKTLSAFLVFIDRLLAEAREGALRQELSLIYVSPLKSLAGDIRENLRRPLDGIFREEHGGEGFADEAGNPVRVAMRTGDTPQSERRRMVKTPPHILITTPESLYLMLTAKASRQMLRTARWIIVDELHALIDTKRGAHLMLSIARLDGLCPRPLQRIGLSATLEPLELAAEYLSPDGAAIAAPKMRKAVELLVTSPLTDRPKVRKDPVWQDVARAVWEHCEGARSVIAFVEGRAYAEKLAYYVNQLGGEGFARTHHGSLSKEQRLEVERALRGGSLRLLCATSSMELGIDVGDVDRVFQIGCPRSISSAMQRLGRAGHNPNRTSVMHIFPRAAAEGLYSGLAAEVVRRGGVEHSRPPRLCLDVLAQHLVSMAADGGYDVDEVMELLPRAYPFRDVAREDVRAVLRMLAGDDEHGRDIPVRPRVLYDRIHDRVGGDPYSRMLAVSAGGTIPDRGLYTVRTADGVKLGELDEEFVFEARKGDKFLLGTFAWQISDIKKDAVVVVPSTVSGAQPPFWKGEIRGRRLQTGLAYGEIFRRLSAAREACSLLQALRELGLDEAAARDVEDLLRRQLAAAGALPDDRTLLVEHFRDETGNRQMMVHSVFGRPVNEPLAILAAEAAKRLTGANMHFAADDDGFLLFPYSDCELPERLLYKIPAASAGPVLEAALPAAPVFNMAFRYNAARALMMGMRKSGRQPLWVQRLRGAELLDSLVKKRDHPLVRETRRECLEDIWDLPGVEFVLNGIRAGTIRVVELYQETPSPMSMPLRRQTEAAMMYDYAPTTPGIHAAVEEELGRARMIAPAPEQLARASVRARAPENGNQLHALLMAEGDMEACELGAPIEWMEALERDGRAEYVEPGLWVAAEHAEEYAAALGGNDAEARGHIVRRLLRYRGAQSPERVAERYLWAEDAARGVLEALCRGGAAVEYEGLYYHGELFDRAQRETVRLRRRQARTLPPERYAALLAGRVRLSGPPGERLEEALKPLCGLPYPAAWWEGLLLPARVAGYRPELLDALLSQGKLYWRMAPDGELAFHPYDDIDWEADGTETGEALEGDEKILFDALMKRGASFAHNLSGLFGGAPPHDALLRLAGKGVVSADSFVPVRQWIGRERIEGMPVRQRVRSRVLALTAGRWELARPVKALAVEQQLERAFARSMLLCRETAQGLEWAEALKVLRVWEYTGRARRGYFIEGMSGMQYMLDGDYAGITLALEQPDERFVWLPAVDPMQPWGKYFAHDPEKSFLSVPGTAVALKAGLPVAVFEQQGKALRVFDAGALAEALAAFAQDFNARRIYPALRRLTVRQYPREAAEALKSAGFSGEMRDYVLYRGT